MISDPLQMIRQQIEAAEADLRDYAPAAANWKARCIETASTILPWLCENSRPIRRHLEQVLNSPRTLRSAWSELRASQGLNTSLTEAVSRSLRSQEILMSLISGDVVSRIISRFLTAEYPNGGLRENGSSDYPDLYLTAKDYGFLPAFNRNSKVYAAALKGSQRRPVRVPDGIEIKTCRGKLRVDCHHPHLGLHLALLFAGSAETEPYAVTDIQVAFLRPCDYHESKRNTTATTVKYSFNQDRFISVCGGSGRTP